MYTYFIGFVILILNLQQSNCTYSIKNVKFELSDRKFRVSIPNEPGIKYVAFHINVNKDFRSFETGQLYGLATSFTNDHLWAYEFSRALQDTDMIYLWLAVQWNSLLYRDRQGPISVATLRAANDPTDTHNTSETPGADTDPKTPPVSDDVNRDHICIPTITELPMARRRCKNDLIFEDNFEELSSNRWTNEVRIPLDSEDAEFVLYNGTARVENSFMRIPAVLWQGRITRGVIDLGERCTSTNFAECRLQAQSSYYLPPVVSGRINTKQSFTFKYGRVEVRARLPKGDWLVPLISLQPATHKYGFKQYTNGEIRIAFARGNNQLMSDNADISGKRLFGGVILSANADERHRFMANATLDDVIGFEEHFGNQFHLYSLIWKPNELLFFVDGYEYGKIKTNFKEKMNDPAWRLGPDNAPLDQMCYVTLGLSAGGHGDFPNHSENKPWQNRSPRANLQFYNKHGDWHPTWENPQLEVDFVRVYAI